MSLLFNLKKLKLWGEEVTQDKINFEWPTEKMLKGLPKNAYLSSIEFKTNDANSSAISSVRCILSNGLSSLLFQKEGHEHYYSRTIALNSNTVKRVQAKIET